MDARGRRQGRNAAFAACTAMFLLLAAGGNEPAFTGA